MSLKKISENLRKDLNLAFQSEILIRNFDKIVKCCFLNLISPTSNLKIFDSIGGALKLTNEVEDLNRVFNLMMMLICEIHHLKLTEIEIKALLDDLTPTKEFTESFADKYAQFKEYIDSFESNLNDTLFNSSINFKKIVDVEWQMVQNVSTKHMLKVAKDVYFITLKILNENDALKELKFKCNHEELLDLVSTLQTAYKCINDERQSLY